MTIPREDEATEHHSLAQVSARIPRGVICLLSALHYHVLTTNTPWQVWLAVDRPTRAPRALPALRVVRFSGASMNSEIETRIIENVPVRIYGVAKTVADCFKYRNKVGVDVAIEALRNAWGQNRCSMDALWQAAAICRVSTVMRPYLEMVAL